MRWSMIYVSRSKTDSSKLVLRVHDIGDSNNLMMEMRIGAVSFSNPENLAIVQDEFAQEVAEVISKKRNMPLES